nr:free fatty acid receptor 4-like [Crassostrea gigas]
MMSSMNKSYLFGMDYEQGWGNTSYFTYFSEFNRPWLGLPYIEAAVLIILFIFSLCGNFTVFFQILKVKSTRTVTNYLICNLAVADILFSSGSPLIATARLTGTWVLGTLVCKMLVYVMFICASVMIWTMTIISIDRYTCILKTSSKKITPQAAICSILLLWILDSLAFIPLSMYFTVKKVPFGYEEIKICTLMWPNTSNIRISMIFTVSVCLVGFVIPLAILVLNYFRILKKFWRSRNAVKAITTRSVKSRKQRDIRLVKNLILLVFLFLVMWLPIFIVFVLIQADGMANSMNISSQALIGTLCLALGNACVNPFLYGIMNDRLKRRILRNVYRRNEKTLLATPDSKTENSGSNTGCQGPSVTSSS